MCVFVCIYVHMHLSVCTLSVCFESLNVGSETGVFL